MMMVDDDWPHCSKCGTVTSDCLYLFGGKPSRYGDTPVCDECWHEAEDDIDYERTLRSLKGWL